jgi:hypothetical protein
MGGSVIILAHAADTGALAVGRCLLERLGERRVRWLAPEQLDRARWHHRIGANGRADTRLTLPGGVALDDADIALLWNRLRGIAQPRFTHAAAKDAAYAAAELQAAVVSWLGGLGQRAVPDARRHPWICIPAGWAERRRWALEAERCGLPVHDALTRLVAPRAGSPVGHAALHSTAPPVAAQLLLAGQRWHARPESSREQAWLATLAPRCRQLASNLGLPVLALGFGLDGQGRGVLVDIDPFPGLPGLDQAAHVADFLADEVAALALQATMTAPAMADSA